MYLFIIYCTLNNNIEIMGYFCLLGCLRLVGSCFMGIWDACAEDRWLCIFGRAILVHFVGFWIVSIASVVLEGARILICIKDS